MAVLLSNNAQGSLSAGISAAVTSLVVGAGEGALFPAISGADYYMATLVNASNQLEIVKVTARSADTMTIVRGQEGTTARAYSAADKIEVRMTAGGWANKLDKDTGGTIAGSLAITGNLQVDGNTILGNAPGDTVTFGASIFTLPAGGITATGGVVNFASGLQTGGVTVAGISGLQTLTGKTLTAPVIATIVNGGTLTLPSITDTLVCRTATETLTNKTLTSPTINGGTWSGAITGGGATVTGGTFVGVTISASDVGTITHFSELRMTTASGGLQTVSISVGMVSLVNVAGVPRRFTAVAATLNLAAAAGLNAIDTGVVAPNSFYAVWLAYSGASIGVIGSLSGTAPTFPAGYGGVRIGWVQTDSSGFVIPFVKTDDEVQFISTGSPIIIGSGLVGNVTTPSYSPVTVVGVTVPTTAVAIDIGMFCVSGNVVIAGPNNSYGAWNSSANPPYASTGNSNGTVRARIRMETVNYYYASNGSTNRIILTGYQDSV